MEARHGANPTEHGPSLRERIHALHDNGYHFEHTANFPENGIHQRFGEVFEMATAYEESEVHRCFDAAKKLVREASRDKDGDKSHSGYSGTMADMREALLHYGTSPPFSCLGLWQYPNANLASLIKASQEMATQPSPTKRSLELYRDIIAQKSRAANGESILLYGKKGDPVPPYLTTIWDEHADDSIEEIIIDWLMDPFLALITNPFRSILPHIPIIGKRFEGIDRKQRLVDGSITSALAKATMVVLAILCLTTAIIVLNEMKDSRTRILVAALFAQVFALPIQFLSPRSLPLYMLIIA
jgi:hypothetical protein